MKSANVCCPFDSMFALIVHYACWTDGNTMLIYTHEKQTWGY